MNSAFRVLLTLGIAGAILIVLMGPRWRGSFYHSWLRPRLLAFGVLLAIFTTGLYLFRVFNFFRNH